MKKTIFALFAIASVSAFAGAGDLLVTFSTPGWDTYADGMPVCSNETYGLFYTDSAGVQNPTPVLTYRTKAAGRCTPVMFVIDESKAGNYRDGTLEVYLLDTRTNDGTSMGAPKGIVDGEPIVKSKTASATVSVTSGEMFNGGDSSDAVAFDIPQPVITGIEFDGDYVQLGVKGLVPCVGYKLQSGTDTTNITTPKGDIEFKSETTISVLKTSSGQFFKVTTK